MTLIQYRQLRLSRLCNTTMIGLIITILVLAGCASSGPRVISKPKPVSQIDLDSIPNPQPRHENFSRYGNPASYEVFGRRYYTRQNNLGFREQGLASWYGPNFHGKRTSSGEPYDMYKMTAAHKSIRLPAYVEVTNLKNGRKIVVRVNDRGPFHDNRIIDLSYVAAAKLDLIRQGTGAVEIRVIDPANPMAHRKDILPPQVVQGRAAPMTSVESSSTQRGSPAVTTPRTTASTPPSVKQAPQVSATPLPRAGQAPQASSYRSPEDLRKENITPTDKQMFVQLGAFSEQQNAQRLKQRVQGIVNRQIAVVSEPSNGRHLFKVRIGPLSSVALADSIVDRLNNAGLYDHRVVFQ